MRWCGAVTWEEVLRELPNARRWVLDTSRWGCFPNAEDWENAVFDAVLYAAEHYSPDRGAAFSSYVLSVVRWKMTTLVHRTVHHRHRDIAEAIQKYGSPLALKDPQSPCDPVRQAVANEEVALVREALVQLPENWRLVIEGLYFRQISRKQLARELGICRERVGQIYLKARAMLQTLLRARGVNPCP